MTRDTELSRKEATPTVSSLTGLGHMKSYYIFVFCFLALFALLEFADLDAEYDSMGWTIQHDEKLVVPDARTFYLGGDQKLSDYREPVSAGFGILGPYLTSLGFRLFGLNNYGLRIVYTVMCVASMALLSLSLLRLHPSWLGVLFCVVNLINYRYFVLAHYALLEDVLILSLCGIAWLYLCRPKTFMAYLNPLAFFGGALFLFKQVFPVYWVSLLGCIAVAERVPRRGLAKLLFWSLAGLILFGFLQLAVLHGMGILSIFTHNIARAVHLFTSGSSEGLSLQTYPEPPGLVGIVPHYVRLFAFWHLPLYLDWYIWHGWIPVGRWQANAAIVVFFALLGATLWLLRKKKLANRTLALGMFLVGMLAVLSPMSFYIKRALPLFPITSLFLCSLLRDVLDGISGTSMAKLLNRGAVWCIGVFILYYVIWQGAYVLVAGSQIRTYAVERNSRDLEKLVPEKAAVYMHCYGFRFFWQTRRRIISGDDQLMNNEMILAKALREQARFVLLSGRGGEIDQNQDCPPWRVQKRHLYFSDMTDSGHPDVYVLLELAYGEEGRRGVGAEPS
jgi:hypothetical protein